MQMNDQVEFIGKIIGLISFTSLGALLWSRIKEIREDNQSRENSLSNLLNDNIELDLNEYESNMLDRLSKANNCNSNRQYLRAKIKQLIEEEN